MIRKLLLAEAIAVVIIFLLSGCASTTVTMTPQPPTSLCQAASDRASALVLWAPRWRPNQKDVALREAAAQQGISRFFETSACFAHTEVRRVSLESAGQQEQVQRLAASAEHQPDRVLVIVVRELGPIVKLLSSAALVEGGTEVVLDVSYYGAHGSGPASQYTVHWQNAGPGVVKGVATLPTDMEAALISSLKPSTR
jgi:hypothetical protein